MENVYKKNCPGSVFRTVFLVGTYTHGHVTVKTASLALEPVSDTVQWRVVGLIVHLPALYICTCTMRACVHVFTRHCESPNFTVCGNSGVCTDAEMSSTNNDMRKKLGFSLNPLLVRPHTICRVATLFSESLDKLGN